MSVFAVCSGKGSPGTSFVSVNLAAAMARAGGEVLLVDLDPAGGDLCCYLGLNPRRGLYPLVRMEGDIPGPDSLLAEAEERSGFLAVCGFPRASDLPSPGVLRAALEAARGSGRTVLADLGRISEANGPLAGEADRVILIVRPDLVSVLGAERALRCLESAGVPPERISAVISGVERRRSGDIAEVREALGVPVFGVVLMDRRGARKALIAQAPAESRPLTRAFDALTVAIGGGRLRNGGELDAAAEPVGMGVTA
jgi:Flp pilus assembly CpaE family ATPase